MGDCLSDIFEDPEFGRNDFTGTASSEDLFSILERLEAANKDIVPFSPFDETVFSPRANDEPTAGLLSQRSTSSTVRPHHETDDDDDEDASQARKKLKFMTPAALMEAVQDGQNKISHITVERNRRKQMNDNLSVLRSLMPCFYVKRGDQASIIGGVVDYIKELQQLLQSLEAKKQRKVYSEVLSPRPAASSPRPPPLSPRPSPLSPRPSPLSPRVGLPISPRTPQPGSPYKPRMQQAYISPTTMAPYNESPLSFDSVGELAANSKSAIADVEVKFSGPNILLKTVSHRIPGQALKIIDALEGLPLEILQVSISTIDETMLYSFTIKIGIECQLSAEELAQEIQRTFS